MKKCNKCLLVKSDDEFQSNRKACRSCRSIYSHQLYKKKNPRAKRKGERSRHKVEDSVLVESLKTQTSIAAALRSVGLAFYGMAGYVRCRRLIAKYRIDTSHFRTSTSGKCIGPKRPIEDYLSGKQSIHSHNLRLRLIKEGIKSHQCECCLNTKWNKSPIPLELHHLDGNRKNNRLSNLQLLCPNCHAQTETYCSKKY